MSRLAFGGSPWARNELARDPMASTLLHNQAENLRANVSIVGKTERGPWVVSLYGSDRTLQFRGDDLADTIAFGLDRWAAGASDHGISWRCTADRLAHAHHRGRQARALCGVEAVPETTAWSELRRCRACWRALDGRIRTVAA